MDDNLTVRVVVPFVGIGALLLLLVRVDLVPDLTQNAPQLVSNAAAFLTN